MRYQLQTEAPFDSWYYGLDGSIRRRIAATLDRMASGNLGDYRPLRNAPGIYERRLTFGGGIRIYFAWDGPTLIILLGAGNKSSQLQDISAARSTWESYNAV
ncbi:MAG: type II toxin-antitoxin system RelE/ParE family toxin [Chloroflexota bacterium]|nr:type II toxin-antitoxin system RelE/ParE family toxin [Chloroflexota bacterium]MDE2684778.1 type II toxin-antitoxin system RelE/ParE family toxin [Chloroflexota bacterium]